MKLSKIVSYAASFLASRETIKNISENTVDFRKETLLREYLLHKNEAQDIMEYGERITHLFPNNCFYAHLSLYYLACSFINEGDHILDAGSGSGYGSAYLAGRHKGKVLGIELSRKAVDFIRKYFQLPNLEYRRMDLENVKGIKKEFFDFIFSSNVLEHVENVRAFLDDAVAILEPQGRLFVAVPPLVSDREISANIDIPQHLNIWSPIQWAYVLSKYFKDIRCFVLVNKPGIGSGDFNNDPEDPTFTEEDFALQEVVAGEVGFKVGGYGVVYVAGVPLPQNERNVVDSAEYIDGSYTRPRAVVEQYNWLSIVGELTYDTKIIQSFYFDREICQVDILYTTYGRTNTPDVIFKLTDDTHSDNALFECVVNASLLKDNNWYEYRFPSVRSKTGVYHIVISSPNGVPGNAITVRSSDKKCFDGGMLFANDEKQVVDITFRVFENNPIYSAYHDRRMRHHPFHMGFITCSDDQEERVYSLENGVRKLVRSPEEAMTKMGFESGDIVPIAGGLMAQIPAADPS